MISKKSNNKTIVLNLNFINIKKTSLQQVQEKILKSIKIEVQSPYKMRITKDQELIMNNLKPQDLQI
ncbi:hypothetical protein RirG_169150 [Rhizophagus irregularis DAOM 197198w]|uniref:Uncharacterized protein n=1 Tax=Rhizophagus irregularis (strain DAOM 197198w) TaxID=1432141 RepID=A0A015IWN5_RHIIW|nr:hypothetical protein RirG_169150 [Rhizophagus irregularis DAOM 197198w]